MTTTDAGDDAYVTQRCIDCSSVGEEGDVQEAKDLQDLEDIEEAQGADQKVSLVGKGTDLLLGNIHPKLNEIPKKVALIMAFWCLPPTSASSDISRGTIGPTARRSWPVSVGLKEAVQQTNLLFFTFVHVFST